MKVELKKVVHSPGLSDDSEAFSAEVYIDGVIVAYVRDDGNGGCLRFDAYASPKLRGKDEQQLAAMRANDKIMDAYDEWGKTQPATKVTEENPEGYPVTLENTVTDLFFAWLIEKDLVKHRRKLEKDKLTQLCYVLEGENPDDGYRQLKWKGLAKLTRTYFDSGAEHLLKKYGTGNFTILNERPGE